MGDLEFRDGKWRTKKHPQQPRRPPPDVLTLPPGSLDAAIADALRVAWRNYTTTGDWYDSVGIPTMAVVAAEAARKYDGDRNRA